ncbi:response regulator [Paenibacillus sp. GCM10023250]|uniref:response regulator n=1 Tax=Paenibacillus sp. GCM10023250 TaxID=3252648 RepID=UPI0036139446
MIRAMVVDDEKLVRKGFISVIDWASFGIVIAQEAADGRAALELLEKQEVDLLFTDLTMPGMDGFELLAQVRTRYPRMKSVVLTCHHEFDYVQEAMRLGAIDYIVKTVLDMDNVDDVMNRIVDRVRWEASSRAAYAPGAGADRDRFTSGEALAFVPLDADADPAELLRLPFAQRHAMHELAGGIRMAQLAPPGWTPELKRELEGLPAARWRTALVAGLEDRPLADVKRALGERLARHLFYAPEPADGRPAEIPYEALAKARPDADAGLDAAFDGWLAVKWALGAGEWDAFERALTDLRPAPERLDAFARALEQEWAGVLLDAEALRRLNADRAPRQAWAPWRDWFRLFADLAQRRMLELSLSREVMASLIQAVRYMRRHAGDKINQADVALHINMSRSYFSQCFTRFAGQSFGETLRGMRIERAKTLLLASDAPVYEIASLAGFEDDKYFSRVFKERVGLLPTEYRSQRGKTVGSR